ncbi:MAG: response regulator [Deltaproteobacteria bacterium]|jgi:putative two-component system response regulator|nr:response regulator [Deltaproteobacteria bacterium]
MTQHKKIVLVDDDITNLTVGKNTLSDDYDILTIPSGKKLLQLLDMIHPDLILLDINMPDMDGYEVIQRLKQNDKTADIPVIFLTAKSDVDSELRGFTLGAIDYISKPFSPPILRKRIETQLLVQKQQGELKRYNDNLQDIVREKTKTVVELQNAVLCTVAELVECRDDITGGHITRTQNYLKILLDETVRQKIYSEEVAQCQESEFLLLSAQLHDVGKIMVPDVILKKPGALTPEEFEMIKLHPVWGADIIEMIGQKTREKDFLLNARIFALYHHEKWNGTGYPSKLSGDKIPLLGRMMAIADVYDALVTKRPYKPPLEHEQARKIILEGNGSHFDPLLVGVFAAVAHQFAVAATAQADNGLQSTPVS